MRVLLALALLAAAPPVASPPVPEGEVRGLWVVRTALVSPSAVDETVNRAAEAGFNALFVQVRGRGDAFYRSRMVPRSPLLEGQPPEFDPLARLLTAARSRGMAVHAWVNVLLVAGYGQRLPPGHVAAVHPEWLMVPRPVAATARHASPDLVRGLVEGAARNGDVEGHYLSPSAPGVGAHLETVVRELVSGYRVDGLHLDFIRYPGPTFDYSRWALSGYAGAGRGDPLRNPESGAWAEYRRTVLGHLTRRLAQAARRARPGTLVSAAVIPDETLAVEQRYQDWPSWIRSGTLDAVVPMVYTPDERLFSAQVSTARARVGADRALWAGVGAYRLDTDGAAARVRQARASGASGIVVFSHEWLASADVRRFRAGAFPEEARSGSPGSTTR